MKIERRVYIGLSERAKRVNISAFSTHPYCFSPPFEAFKSEQAFMQASTHDISGGLPLSVLCLKHFMGRSVMRGG